MPLIGEGSYGCIFKPIVTCKHEKKLPRDTIGKVFIDYSEFDIEKTIQEKIKVIDPKNEFTLPLYDVCDIKKFSQHDNVEKCTLISNNNDKINEYPQLIYKYGGIDLKNIIKNDLGNVKKFMDLFVKFRPIFVGIKKMINANYIHQDIKPPNILYNKKTKKIYLIDFGILTYSQDIYKHNNSYVLKYDYPYYPPEYKLFVNNKDSFIKYYNKVLKNFHFDFVIGNKHIDLLRIIYEDIGVDVVDDLKKVYDNPKNIFNPSKIDLYSLGIVILELFIWSGLYNKKKTNTINKELQSKMKVFLKGLIRFNSLERYDILKTINSFDEIVNFWENNK